jgi:cytochrome c-type biogenesis protein CcmH/NrfG
LFDASREREQRAALLAAAAGHESPAGRAQPPTGLSLLESSVVGLRNVRASGLSPSAAPVTASPAAEGKPAVLSLSRTTLVSRHSRWLRRFFLIFGAALLAAIVFNIYMTRRLDAEATTGKAQEPLASRAPSASDLARLAQASPVRIASSALAVTTATGLSSGELAAARPPRGAEPSVAPPPPSRPYRPAAALPAASVAAAETTAGSAAELPSDKTRPRASAEGKKAMAEARAAFERDDFSRAILQGRAALAAGEGGAHAILGAAYFKVGRFEDAVREYGEALRLEPSNPALARRVEIARRAAGRRAEGASP